MIHYLDKVMTLFENWFLINQFQKKLKVQRLFHSDDFRSISIRDIKYNLTESQSLVIKYLYEHFLRGTPEITSQKIISHIDEERGINTSSRLVDIFKHNKSAYKNLIVSGYVKGHVKINIS